MVSRRVGFLHLPPRHRHLLFHARASCTRATDSDASRTTPSSTRSAPRSGASWGRTQRAAGTSSRRAPRGQSGGREVGPGERARRWSPRSRRSCRARWGCCRCTLLRERRSSFVELYASDNLGKTNYGTAGYLGDGYFVTVKHAVVALKDEDDRQGTRKIDVDQDGATRARRSRRRLVDTGDADVEVAQRRLGDHQDARSSTCRRCASTPAFAYEFADPIFRLGNDYSKGIILSTGYVGQRTANGLVTCLTDGHPGVSGGGVLDQRGDLVGIPIGRMQGDYRFSFILPIRAEMLRKVPAYEQAEPQPTPAAAAVVAAEQ